MKLLWIYLFFVFSFSFDIAKGEEDVFARPLIQNIQQRHEEGVKGNGEAVKSLIADLEKLTKEQPQDPLLQVYLGSAYTLRSRDLFIGPQKYSFLKNGLELMDQAVAEAPADPAVRFVRAVNNYNLPFFCNRQQTARDDFQILLKQIEENKRVALSTETTQAIYYYAGLSQLQDHHKKQANAIWLRGLQLAPGTPLADKISNALLKNQI